MVVDDQIAVSITDTAGAIEDHPDRTIEACSTEPYLIFRSHPAVVAELVDAQR